MKSFARFMSSTAGRVLRIVAGIALIAWGLFGMQPDSGYIVAAIGAVPLLTGLIDICVLAPLFGLSLNGAETRSAK